MAVLLFDIDGTLLRAHGLGRTLYERAASALLGRDVDAAGIPFAGRTDRAIARDLLVREGVAVDRLEASLDALLADYQVSFCREVTDDQVAIIPGIHDLLARLTLRGDVHLGVLTGNLQSTAAAKLRAAGLAGRFPFGAFGSDHEDRNALPDVARVRASAHLGRDVSHDELIVIGDTPHDVACGKAVGALTVGVCTGYIPAETLADAEPDLLLPDFLDPDPFLGLIDRWFEDRAAS